MKKLIWIIGGLLLGMVVVLASTKGIKNVITGSAAFVDSKDLKAGAFRKITVADLPEVGKATPNFAPPVPRPEGAMPVAPAGFKVELYAHDGLKAPRQIRRAPNGDMFLAEQSSGEIKIVRDNKGKPEISGFATGLKVPFGINFYPPGPNPQWVYIGNTGSVVRFRSEER